MLVHPARRHAEPIRGLARCQPALRLQAAHREHGRPRRGYQQQRRQRVVPLRHLQRVGLGQHGPDSIDGLLRRHHALAREQAPATGSLARQSRGGGL